jgi:hypothetical protein
MCDRGEVDMIAHGSVICKHGIKTRMTATHFSKKLVYISD